MQYRERIYGRVFIFDSQIFENHRVLEKNGLDTHKNYRVLKGERQ